VVVTNKAFYVYVLDRVTGQPIFPIVETPFPASNVPGEVASKTQPIPQLPHPLTHKEITVDDLINDTPEDNAAARDMFSKLWGGGKPFVPLGLNQNTLVIPGFGGGWGGTAADHDGVFYSSAGNGAGMSSIADNKEHRAAIGEPGAPGPVGGYQNGFARLDYAFTGYGQFRLPGGKSALSPAASAATLNAIDINTGQYRWTVPLPGRNGGSGPLVTASGLLFIGAADNLEAFDTKDGKMLWQQKLPSSGANSPGTYMVDGKQYVMLASGGQTAAYVAYALP
jgi:quinoprotein glucose dehydrogenase